MLFQTSYWTASSSCHVPSAAAIDCESGIKSSSIIVDGQFWCQPIRNEENGHFKLVLNSEGVFLWGGGGS